MNTQLKITLSSAKISLAEIIQTIRKYIYDFKFSMFEFDGTMRENSPYMINTISSQAINNLHGFQLDFEELSNFSLYIYQTYDLILVGNTGTLKLYNDTEDWKIKNPIVIEMLDCGDWEIYSSDINIINNIKKIQIYK